MGASASVPLCGKKRVYQVEAFITVFLVQGKGAGDGDAGVQLRVYLPVG